MRETPTRPTSQPRPSPRAGPCQLVESDRDLPLDLTTAGRSYSPMPQHFPSRPRKRAPRGVYGVAQISWIDSGGTTVLMISRTATPGVPATGPLISIKCAQRACQATALAGNDSTKVSRPAHRAPPSNNISTPWHVHTATVLQVLAVTTAFTVGGAPARTRPRAVPMASAQDLHECLMAVSLH